MFGRRDDDYYPNGYPNDREATSPAPKVVYTIAPTGRIPSEWAVLGDGEVLAVIHGAMSLTAVGAFLHALETQFNGLRHAIDHLCPHKG